MYRSDPNFKHVTLPLSSDFSTPVLLGEMIFLMRVRCTISPVRFITSRTSWLVNPWRFTPSNCAHRHKDNQEVTVGPANRALQLASTGLISLVWGWGEHDSWPRPCSNPLLLNCESMQDERDVSRSWRPVLSGCSYGHGAN